ncbi:MAG: response regulator receiver sensor signal transduction histidine kinase [Rariglobus sp.]|jgi:DNA-binding response OmpR family regulator|nr:response regulator receiver sensor signal transduction histidine kinase [Rariglobus sp.]
MPVPKILVVDDQPINVQLLKRKLEKEGIEILTAYNGQEALDQVARVKPDLILLDVMMPDMDGIEVCQRLQSDEASRHIPIIFVTARTSKEGKLEGLGVGAVDYITKPLDLDETLARVQTQLRFVQINREMLDLQRRLVEARRAATIGAVTQGVAHNLNNLLGVVLGYLDLIKSHYDKPEQVKKNAQSVENAVQRIVSIIRQLSSLVVKSRLPLVRCKLNEVIDSSIARYQSENKITAPVTIENPLGEYPIDTHVEIFEDILGKVLINAWEAYDEKPAGERPIWLRTALVEKSEGKMIEITIDDAGHGIAEDIRDRMFEPFISSKHTVGVGMGLTVARHALRNLGGEVSLNDRPGGGSSATVTHPAERKVKKALRG